MLYRGEPFGTVAFGVPYFKGIHPFWQWWSLLLLGGFEPGDIFLNGQANLPGEILIPESHNNLVRAMLETDADTLCIIEDDHSGDQDVVRRMREKQENWQFDIVCASYTDRRGVARAVGVDFTDQNERGEVKCRIEPLSVARSGTQRYDCAALGLVLIRRWLLEEMAAGGDPAETFWFELNGRNSQDIQFYQKAQVLGGVVGVDRDNWLIHWGLYGWGPEAFFRWQDQKRAEVR